MSQSKQLIESIVSKQYPQSQSITVLIISKQEQMQKFTISHLIAHCKVCFPLFDLSWLEIPSMIAILLVLCSFEDDDPPVSLQSL